MQGLTRVSENTAVLVCGFISACSPACLLSAHGHLTFMSQEEREGGVRTPP